MQKSKKTKPLLITLPLLALLGAAAALILTHTPAEVSSQPIEYINHPDYDLVVDQWNKEYPILEEVTLQAELEYYPEGTQHILLIGENRSEHIVYAGGYILQKYDGASDKWVCVYTEDADENDTWHSNNEYYLMQNQFKKSTCSLRMYVGHITEGVYRIKIQYFAIDEDTVDWTHDYLRNMYAQFTITKDTSLHKPSELDYKYAGRSERIPFNYAFYTHEIGTPITPVHVYKNLATLDYDMVINGKDTITIASGKHQQTAEALINCIYSPDHQYLIYTLYNESPPYSAQCIVYDVVNKKEILRSDPFENCVMTVSERWDIGDGSYEVIAVEYEESTATHKDRMQRIYRSVKRTNTYSYQLKFEDGEFKFTENIGQAYFDTN